MMSFRGMKPEILIRLSKPDQQINAPFEQMCQKQFDEVLVNAHFFLVNTPSLRISFWYILEISINGVLQKLVIYHVYSDSRCSMLAVFAYFSTPRIRDILM
jgi:hypothetical protein